MGSCMSSDERDKYIKKLVVVATDKTVTVKKRMTAKKKLENQLKLKYNEHHVRCFRKDFVTKTMDVREPDPEHPGMVGKFYTYYTNNYGGVCLHSPYGPEPPPLSPSVSSDSDRSYDSCSDYRGCGVRYGGGGGGGFGGGGFAGNAY